MFVSQKIVISHIYQQDTHPTSGHQFLTSPAPLRHLSFVGNRWHVLIYEQHYIFVQEENIVLFGHLHRSLESNSKTTVIELTALVLMLLPSSNNSKRFKDNFFLLSGKYLKRYFQNLTISSFCGTFLQSKNLMDALASILFSHPFLLSAHICNKNSRQVVK